MDIKAKKTINLAMDKMTKGRIELKSTQKTSVKTTMENMTKNIAMASKTKKTIKSAAKSSMLAFMLSKEVKKQELLRRKSKKLTNKNPLVKDEKTSMDVTINQCTTDQTFSLEGSIESSNSKLHAAFSESNDNKSHIIDQLYHSKQSYHVPNSEDLVVDEALSLDSSESRSCSTKHILLSNLNTR